ncbi:YagK/YfjJ domain-containing protein [Pseudomonas aeruginosa]|uniref:YagK/YfjJ domain-containing protein n=1 Tax=Pseudomonas aeruginosa TaxID=287 RepID=UPI0024960E84|nr:inovirus-type Gp2 protein [Pseudomonas aeruginosa]MDI2410859.1 inovirus Gp2 family protein [Pseudomonas aeruginosa]
MSNTVTCAPCFKGVAINSGKFRSLGLYVEILDSYLTQITNLFTYTSRITIMRFDLHLPHGKFFTPDEGNQLVSDFFKSMKEHLARVKWKSHQQVIFGWAREVETNASGHYHCFIGFKAVFKFLGEVSKGRCTHVWGLIESRWKRISGGSMQANGYHTVNRGEPKELDDAFFHISYLAKTKGKVFCTGETHKRYSASRLKPNSKQTSLSIAA